MRRRRAHEARSAADRDLHRHVGRAEAAVRAALDVCGRASRRVEGSEGSFRQKFQVLQTVERHLAAIGHLEDAPSGQPDLREEARALVAWLESRERVAGIHRPSRRGQEYQDRLQGVLRLLAGIKPDAEPPTDLKKTPVSAGPVAVLAEAQAFGVMDGTE